MSAAGKLKYSRLFPSQVTICNETVGELLATVALLEQGVSLLLTPQRSMAVDAGGEAFYSEAPVARFGQKNGNCFDFTLLTEIRWKWLLLYV